MSMIFPGMDPYLENPLIWSGLHAVFVVYLRDELQPLLRPRYVAAVEERVYVEGPEREIIPDVAVRRRRPLAVTQGAAVAEPETPELIRIPALEVHETYVAILDRQYRRRIVTVIELLSPTNKYAGPGRKSYRAKQRAVMRSTTHLVELDFLRLGPHVLAVAESAVRAGKPYEYLISVNRAYDLREEFELYRVRLRQRLPRIRVPLGADDPDVVLDLQAVLQRVYDAGDYAGILNYDEACVPPLSSEDQEWANNLIRAASPA